MSFRPARVIMPGVSDHLDRNRRQWNAWAEDFCAPGRRNWSREEIVWGELRVPERELDLLDDFAGKDVLEAGCGTAYFSAWLSRRRARVTGIDLSERQLATALRFQREFGLRFPLVRANAERLPFRDESFDLVLSEYGASIWADPYLWVPEAARLLRPGGQLVFLVNGALLMLCMPDTVPIVPAGERLLRPYFGMHRSEWKSDDAVEFHLPHGEWIRLLRSNALEIEALVELQARPDTEPDTGNPFTVEWARQWPAEEIWKARKRDKGPGAG
jgi:SAM-dependent methyltransferase